MSPFLVTAERTTELWLLHRSSELLNDGCRLSIVPDCNNVHVLAIDCDNRRMIEFKSDLKEGVIINSDYTAVNNNNSNA